MYLAHGRIARKKDPNFSSTLRGPYVAGLGTLTDVTVGVKLAGCKYKSYCCKAYM
jgi:hypothetical protein